MINIKTIKRITWADFVVPAIVCIIGTRFVYAFSFICFAKWSAINSGYYRVLNYTITRKFTHLIYTCINTQLLQSTFLIWILAILTYIIIRRKFHNHIIWARTIYLSGWFLALLLSFYLMVNYSMLFILPNY